MRHRCILHIDMDAFFAAVEELDNPSLAGRPVIVGGTPEGHGVVSTANYVAREFGVHSAMPAARAVKLCPHGVFLRPRGARYADVSREVFRIFRSITPLVEPLSIDEAFLDVTGCPASRTADEAPEVALAREIQDRVERETGGLTCSIGVAENKFLAKIASDLQKPRGLVIVPPGGAVGFLAPLPIERLWGVGPKTAARLRDLGLDTVGSLAGLTERDLVRVCGEELGRHLHRLSHGIDDRPVVTDWEARSISQETTFAVFLRPDDQDAVEGVLFRLADGVAFRLRQEALWGRTIHLKVRNDRFHTVTRALTLESPTQFVEEIFSGAVKLLRERVRLEGRSIRLLGVGATQLVRRPLRQLDLFDHSADEEEQARRRAEVADAIREKLGDAAITRARLLPEGHPDRRRTPRRRE